MVTEWKWLQNEEAKERENNRAKGWEGEKTTDCDSRREMKHLKIWEQWKEGKKELKESTGIRKK